MEKSDMRHVAAAAYPLIVAVTCISACGDAGDHEPASDSLFVIPVTAESCGDCITLGDSVRIGSERDSLIISSVPRVAVDSRGRTYIAESIGAPRLIMVYDREGKFIGTIGALGHGPGEYEVVWSMTVGPGDSLFVATDFRELMVFSPDGVLAREVRTDLSDPRFMAVLPDGRLLAVNAMRAPELEHLPIHLLDQNGRRVRSFGHESLNPPGPIAERLITLGTGGRFWIGEVHNYRFDETDTTGRIFRTFGVTLPDDRVYINRAAIDSAIAATPKVNRTGDIMARPKMMPFRPFLTVGGAHVDSLGRMWTAVRTAVNNWQDVTVTYKQTGDDHAAFSEEVPLLIYETTIDVIDLKSGTLIARRRLDGYGELTTDGRLVRVRSTEEGYLAVTIRSLQLARQGMRERDNYPGTG
jgi:hypothetical protein